MGNIQLNADAASLQDLFNRLDAVGELDSRVKTALTAGAKVILPVAQRKAPVRTGMLKKALKIGRRKKSGHYNSVEVGAFHGEAPHAHLVEHGHGGPHAAVAHAFLEPAVEETEDEAFDAIMAELMKDL